MKNDAMKVMGGVSIYRNETMDGNEINVFFVVGLSTRTSFRMVIHHGIWNGGRISGLLRLGVAFQTFGGEGKESEVRKAEFRQKAPFPNS
jgi:hypothetical protein